VKVIVPVGNRGQVKYSHGSVSEGPVPPPSPGVSPREGPRAVENNKERPYSMPELS